MTKRETRRPITHDRRMRMAALARKKARGHRDGSIGVLITRWHRTARVYIETKNAWGWDAFSPDQVQLTAEQWSRVDRCLDAMEAANAS